MINGEPLKMPCQKCKGSGKVDLSFDLMETLEFVRKKKTATVAEVRKAIDPRHELQSTAFNNRLAQLLELGLLKRNRKSREMVYSPAP